MAARLYPQLRSRGLFGSQGVGLLCSAFALAGCGGGKPRLEILPSRLQVDILRAPTEIRVAAHLRGKKGELLSNPLTWTAAGNGVELSSTVDRYVYLLKILQNAQVGQTAQVTVSADNGKYTATAVVSFVKGDALTTDRATAQHQDGNFPSVAVVGGSLGGCVRDSVFPFVQAGELGDWTTDTCSPPLRPATVFVQFRTPLFQNPWNHPPPPPNHDELDAVVSSIPQQTDPNLPPPPPPPPPYATVKLRAWKLKDAVGNVKDLFEAQRQVANGRYAESLTGVVFVSQSVDPSPVDEDVRDCDGLRNLVQAYPPDPAALNLYYAKSLRFSRRGQWCGGPAEGGGMHPGNLILISTEHDASTTLAHEIGHALAVMEPWSVSGHADAIEGMSWDNIMASGMDDAGTAGRWRFNPGQVFRMRFDRRSWLQASQPAPLDCGCDPYDRRVCPRLSADVTPLADRNATLKPGTCP